MFLALYLALYILITVQLAWAAPATSGSNDPVVSSTSYPTTTGSNEPVLSPTSYLTTTGSDDPVLSPTSYLTTTGSDDPPTSYLTTTGSDDPVLSPTSYLTTTGSDDPVLSPTSSPTTTGSNEPVLSPTSYPTTTGTGAGPSYPTNTPPGPSEIVAAGWYAGWHSSNFTLQDVSWSNYSRVIYAFATTTPDSSVLGLADSDTQLLPQFVDMAHENNVFAILSVGGWGGSIYFSSAVATDANRTAFAKAVVAVAAQYNLDGIEFDWEYPTKKGIGCNIVSANDSANFLSFLQTLRAQDGAQNLTVTAAVSITPFIGSDGTPMSDVSGFADVLDSIEIMNYDIWGSWDSTVGPNAPLDDSCAPSQQGSAMSAVKAWTGANFPINKIILGVASYGHSFHVNQADALDASGNIKLYAPFDKSQQPAGDLWDSTASGVDACGNPNAVGGVFDFWGLIDGGFLTTDGKAASGIDYTFDNCSKTPYVYNPNSQVMISYDDATSFAAKGEYIASEGLGGFAMWQVGGDSSNILLNAISAGAGVGGCSG